MKRNNPSVEITPQFGCGRSGELTGGGITASHYGDTYSGSAGFFKTGEGATFSGSIDRKVSDSLSMGMGGSANTQGQWNAGAKLEIKFG